MGQDFVNDILACAGKLVVAGQAELAAHVAVAAPIEAQCRVLERVGGELVSLVPDIDGPEPRRTLLDWRDHLSSHVLAARALMDVDVDQTIQAQLLERGLAEISASAEAILARA